VKVNPRAARNTGQTIAYLTIQIDAASSGTMNKSSTPNAA